MSSKSKRVFPNSTDDAWHVEGDVKIVKSTSEHAAYLQHHLRSEDVRECLIHGATPWRALHVPLRVKGAQTWTVIHKGCPVCMYGVVPLQEEGVRTATVWMLGSEELNKANMAFNRVTRKVVEWMSEHWDMLENVVPVDHVRTIKWLDFHGFLFSAETTTVNGYECLRFVRCSQNIEVRFE